MTAAERKKGLRAAIDAKVMALTSLPRSSPEFQSHLWLQKEREWIWDVIDSLVDEIEEIHKAVDDYRHASIRLDDVLGVVRPADKEANHGVS